MENANANAKKNYMRGALERIGTKDDPNARVHGALQMRVKSAEKRTTQTGKQTYQVDGYGYFAGPSGIEYAFGKKILGPNGAVTMRATAWDKMSDFVENMHIHSGDLIRVYGSWKIHTWTGKDGQERHSLEASVSKVEIDLRNKEAHTATTPAQTPVVAPAPAPAPAPKVEVPEIMANIDSASPFGDDTIEFDPDTELPF